RICMRVVVVLALFLIAISSIRETLALSNLAIKRVQASGSATAGPAVEFNKLRLEGFDAIYNLDYQTARQKFSTMTRLVPDHPAGYVYLANNLWLETLNRSRRLMTSVYTGSSFYEEVKKEDQVDPKRDREFSDLIKKAIDAAHARLVKDPKDAE